eukprot:RCo006523
MSLPEASCSLLKEGVAGCECTWLRFGRVFALMPLVSYIAYCLDLQPMFIVGRELLRRTYGGAISCEFLHYQKVPEVTLGGHLSFSQRLWRSLGPLREILSTTGSFHTWLWLLYREHPLSLVHRLTLVFSLDLLRRRDVPHANDLMSFLPWLLLLSLFSHALFSAFFCGGLRSSCAVGQSVCPPEAVIFVQKPQSLGNAGLDVEKVSLFSLGTLPLTLHPPSQPPI